MKYFINILGHNVQMNEFFSMILNVDIPNVRPLVVLAVLRPVIVKLPPSPVLCVDGVSGIAKPPTVAVPVLNPA